MKRPSLLIVVSLALNACLIGYVVLHARASTKHSSATGLATPPASSPKPTEKTPATEFSAAINANDYGALRELLVKAGFPDDMVRDIVRTRIWKRYEERVAEITPQPKRTDHWWKDSYEINPYANEPTKAQLDAVQHALREAEDAQRRVLGDEADLADHPLASFLPLEKCAQIQKIEQDYRELRQEVQQSMGGFTLPSDMEKLRLIEEEQERDILAVMTPEERKAYELRVSPTANNLRWDMTRLNVSEDEYLKIFEIQKAFDEKYRNYDPFATTRTDIPPIDWEKRNADELKIKQQIRSLIGDERYNLALKVQDQDYRQLKEATRRFDLPADTAERVYALRDDVTARLKQITDNAQLSIEAKKQALADLATRTRSQVQSSLGAEIAEAYLENGMRWLKALDSGDAIRFSADTNDWEVVPTEQNQAPVIRVE